MVKVQSNHYESGEFIDVTGEHGEQTTKKFRPLSPPPRDCRPRYIMIDPGGVESVWYSAAPKTKQPGESWNEAIERYANAMFPGHDYRLHRTFEENAKDVDKEIEFNLILMFSPIPGGFERNLVCFRERAYICNEKGDTVNAVDGYSR
jgi:hypothetical protein